MASQDTDYSQQIAHLVDAFYARLLRDPLLSPLFLDVAQVDLAEHLPRIKAYWRKMLLGDTDYQRHMMARHREVDSHADFRPEHYERWVQLFEEAAAQHLCEPLASRALPLARRIAGNMRRNLERFPAET